MHAQASFSEPQGVRDVLAFVALKTDRERTAHLLRRFGLGASQAEVDYYAEGGWERAVDRLLNYEAVPERVALDVEAFANDKGQVRIQSVQAWWATKLITTRRPLLEKMTLFWHDHFATSAQKVTQPLLMHEQNETFRKHATGSFRDLLREASKDPAMLIWLDNQFNVKGKPNENFAREVMELFTLGIGHYSEKDIQEAARAFTGWTFRGADREKQAKYRKPEFLFDPKRHDDGMKEVLGSRGPFDGDDVVNLLADDPQTARNIALKIWEWFAYAKPEPDLLDRLTGAFRKEMNIGDLLREVMTSPEFYSERAERTVYKNPVDFVVPTLRQLGVGEMVTLDTKEDGTLAKRPQVAAGVLLTTKAMGMDLFFPPDVSGWEGGAAWISSATMIERVRWADRLFGVAAVGGKPGKAQPTLSYPAYGLLAADPTPPGIASTLVSVFDASIPASKMPALVAAAEKATAGRLTAGNANQAAAAVSRLIFGSPEFQFV